MDKIFIDSDVILDLIQEREPFYQDALSLFSLVERKEIKAHVSPLIFANLYYILRRSGSCKFAIDILLRLKSLVEVLPIDEEIVASALSSGFKDFEDAIQYYTALKAKLGFLITRNKNDYAEKGLIIATPAEYLAKRKAHFHSSNRS